MANAPYSLHIFMKAFLFSCAGFLFAGQGYFALQSRGNVGIHLLCLLGGVFFAFGAWRQAHAVLDGDELRVRYWRKELRVKCRNLSISRRPTAEWPFYVLRTSDGALLKLVRPHWNLGERRWNPPFDSELLAQIDGGEVTTGEKV